MVIRIIIVTLAFCITACSVRTKPFNASRMPAPEKASIVEEITGSYCFCSRHNNLDFPANKNIGGINRNRMSSASTISIESIGTPAEGISVSYSSNNSTGVPVVFDSSTGGCFIKGRKIVCQRPVFQGVALGVGWYTETTEFSVDQTGIVQITDVSSECGLGLLVFPFCEGGL